MRAKVLHLSERPIIADKMSCGQGKIPLGRSSGNLIISLSKFRRNTQEYRAAEMKKDADTEIADKAFNRLLKAKMR